MNCSKMCFILSACTGDIQRHNTLFSQQVSSSVAPVGDRLEVVVCKYIIICILDYLWLYSSNADH